MIGWFASMVYYCAITIFLCYVLTCIDGFRALYDWYFIDRFIRNSDFHRWRVKSFNSLFATKKTIVSDARRLDKERLLWAFKFGNPRKGAKKLVLAELNKRGMNESEISKWMPPLTQLSERRRSNNTAMQAIVIIITTIYQPTPSKAGNIGSANVGSPTRS